MEQPSLLLQGRVALVTGGSRGLGAEACVAFAHAGASVILNYSKNEAAARETAARVQAAGGKALLLAADISREEEVRAMFVRAAEAFGGIDILVNNAGVNSDHLVEELEVAEWDRIMAVNLRGSFLCSKHAIPLMRKRDHDRYAESQPAAQRQA